MTSQGDPVLASLSCSTFAGQPEVAAAPPDCPEGRLNGRVVYVATEADARLGSLAAVRGVLSPLADPLRPPIERATAVVAAATTDRVIAVLPPSKQASEPDAVATAASVTAATVSSGRSDPSPLPAAKVAARPPMVAAAALAAPVAAAAAAAAGSAGESVAAGSMLLKPPVNLDGPGAQAPPADRSAAAPDSSQAALQPQPQLSTLEVLENAISSPNHKPIENPTLLPHKVLTRGGIFKFAEINENGRSRLVVVLNKEGSDKYEIVEVDPYVLLYEMCASYDSCETSPVKDLLIDKPENGSMTVKGFLKFVLEKNEKGQRRIFCFTEKALIDVLFLAKREGVRIDLNEVDPSMRSSLGTRFIDSVNFSKAMIAIDPSVCSHRILKAAQEGCKESALFLFSLNQAPSESDKWIIRAVKDDCSFENEEFERLDPAFKKQIYFIANFNFSRKILKKFNALGMREVPLPRRGLMLFSPNTDVAEAEESVHDFFIDLRRKNLLLNGEEFARLDKSRLVQKDRRPERKSAGLSRVLGRNWIEKKARELNLRHMKVPKKIVVIDNEGRDSISIGFDKKLVPYSEEDFQVWADRIEPSNRCLSREEVIEIFTLIEALHLTDFNADNNFIVAEDGVYFIDTEYKSFSSDSDSPYEYLGERYLEMYLRSHVAEEDREWLISEYDRRRIAYSERKEAGSLFLPETTQQWEDMYSDYSCSRRKFTFQVADLLAAR